MSANAPSLYDRLGGEVMIASLVPAFYVRVLADAELSPFFQHASMEKLHAMQHEFFVMATGGPLTYTGRPLGPVHHGRGISLHHFSRFTHHLIETLLDMGADRVEIDEVIQRINVLANEITGTSY